MYTILLIVIYIAFISLGLPDAILGSAWPIMYGELGVNVSAMGILTMIISGGTILSSAFSAKFINKFGTGKVTAVSVAMTAVALFGFSFSSAFWMLCLWGIPYGLGAGSVDAALNNFVALHYKSRHMSWLHCFWGLGAMIGPYVMGFCLSVNYTWNTGYRVIGIFQTVLVIGLFLTLFMWKKVEKADEDNDIKQRNIGILQVFKIPGAKEVLVAFFCYCAVEQTAGIWASSFLVLHKDIHPETAATWASLFYLGITVGRFLCGFITDSVGDKNMIRLGQIIIGIGILTLFVPFGTGCSLIGLVLIGVGCAPIYPCIIHSTPKNFGPENSQAIMGVQMACAYVGSTFMPPVFGLVAEYINIGLYPVYLLLILVCMVYMLERLNRKIKKYRG